MREILEKINRGAGVRGSAVIAKDGVVVAAALREGLDGERVGAVASALWAGAGKTAREMGWPGARQVVLTGREGRMILADGDRVMLVALAGREANLGLLLVDVGEAVEQLRSAGGRAQS